METGRQHPDPGLADGIQRPAAELLEQQRQPEKSYGRDRDCLSCWAKTRTGGQSARFPGPGPGEISLRLRDAAELPARWNNAMKLLKQNYRRIDSSQGRNVLPFSQKGKKLIPEALAKIKDPRPEAICRGFVQVDPDGGGRSGRQYQAESLPVPAGAEKAGGKLCQDEIQRSRRSGKSVFKY